MRRTDRPLGVVWVALLASGCSLFTANTAVNEEYSRQVSAAALRASTVEAELVGAKTRIEQLEEAVRVQGQTAAQRLETIDQVNSEIARLRGEIETLQFQNNELKLALDGSAVERERRSLHAERRLRQIEELLRIKPPPIPTNEELGLDGGPSDDDTGTVPVEISNPTPVSSAEEAIEIAAQHMTEGRQGVARAILDKALADYPNDRAVPEVLYRIGETWLNEGKWATAASSLQKVVANHPKSEWAPWAMYFQGEAFLKMDKPKDSQAFWDRLVELYPKSESAKQLCREKRVGKEKCK